MDTPGILDHPLEERNTIEMLSITALAHLRAAIIFIIDISEQCSYSIEEQIKLFNSIKPLFTNKPLVVALNKIDVITFENLREDAKALLQELETQNNVYLIPMSTLTEEGVMSVKDFVRVITYSTWQTLIDLYIIKPGMQEIVRTATRPEACHR